MQKEKIKISIIGSHGIYANYGGFDFLVNKLCELKKAIELNILYLTHVKLL